MNQQVKEVQTSDLLPIEAYEEYREIYRKLYGIELSLAESKLKAIEFIDFFKFICTRQVKNG
jgi:hypothetical protein